MYIELILVRSPSLLSVDTQVLLESRTRVSKGNRSIREGDTKIRNKRKEISLEGGVVFFRIIL